ncbi:DUF4846 domain-containing protein [candidate division KSB1 bacterium]|nr:DUF4846 domain-containing protein [candidate division KSB1 bacterium]
MPSNSGRCIASAIQPPAGFTRTQVDSGSFADWLRHLPLKPAGASVLFFNGAAKPNQNAHAAVIDIDVGNRNLQQCADALIRLRAEYLYTVGDFAFIHFNLTSGDNIPYRRWLKGERPIVTDNRVHWRSGFAVDSSYSNFRSYLRTIFIYAGSYSLSKELASRATIWEMQIGDVFIEGGFPGHGVLVVDMAEDTMCGEKLFLLLQSYMPAQDIHILKNLEDDAISPWYRYPAADILRTPEWTFKASDLKYFVP